MGFAGFITGTHMSARDLKRRFALSAQMKNQLMLMDDDSIPQILIAFDMQGPVLLLENLEQVKEETKARELRHAQRSESEIPTISSGINELMGMGYDAYSMKEPINFDKSGRFTIPDHFASLIGLSEEGDSCLLFAAMSTKIAIWSPEVIFSRDEPLFKVRQSMMTSFAKKNKLNIDFGGQNG